MFVYFQKLQMNCKLQILYLLQITGRTQGLELFTIMNHKVFDGCVINILSDYKKDYFPGEFRTGISFVLDKLIGTWHRFRDYREESRINWLWMSGQRTSRCII